MSFACTSTNDSSLSFDENRIIRVSPDNWDSEWGSTTMLLLQRADTEVARRLVWYLLDHS